MIPNDLPEPGVPSTIVPRKGLMMFEPHHTDTQTIGIKKFNDLVAADTRVEKVILPLRDGLTIIRKK